MEKIVIVTSQPKPDQGLLALLNTLFPDCEIHFVLKGVETSEEHSAGCSSDLLMTYMRDTEI